MKGPLEAPVGAHMAPGAKGTRKLVREFGGRLVCVRYRYDEVRGKRLKTIEVVVEEVPWAPPQREVVLIAVNSWETALHAKLRKAGGRWAGEGPFWRVRRDRVVKMGLTKRIRKATSKKLLAAETRMHPLAEAPSPKSAFRFQR